MIRNGIALTQARDREKRNSATPPDRQTTPNELAPEVPISAPPGDGVLPSPVDAFANDVRRTGLGLMDILFDEIDALRSGSGDIQRAMAIGKLAAQIVNVAMLDLRAQEILQDANKKMKTMRLGRR